MVEEEEEEARTPPRFMARRGELAADLAASRAKLAADLGALRASLGISDPPHHSHRGTEGRSHMLVRVALCLESSRCCAGRSLGAKVPSEATRKEIQRITNWWRTTCKMLNEEARTPASLFPPPPLPGDQTRTVKPGWTEQEIRERD